MPLASNFLLAPFFTRVLSPKEYGLIALATIFQNYLSIFIDLGIKGAFSRYFYRYYKRRFAISLLLSTTLISVTIISIAFYGICLFFGDSLFTVFFENNEFTFKRFGHIVFALTFFTLINAIVLSYFRNGEDIKRFALVSLLTFFLMLAGSIVGVFIYKSGAVGSIGGKLVGLGLALLVSFLYIFHFKLRFSKKIFLKIIQYGLPLVPYALLTITINSLDRFFIERFFGLHLLGQYNVAFLISTIPFVLLNAFQSSVNPGIVKMLEEVKDYSNEEVIKKINESFTLMITFMLLIVAVMILASGIFIRYYVGQSYQDIVKYLPVLIVAILPLVYQNVYSIFLFQSYKSKVLPVVAFITLVEGVVFNIALLYWFGFFGIVVGVLIKNIFFAFNTFMAMKRFTNHSKNAISFRKLNFVSVYVIVTSVISSLLMYYLNYNPVLITLISGFVLFLFLVIVFYNSVKKVASKSLSLVVGKLKS